MLFWLCKKKNVCQQGGKKIIKKKPLELTEMNLKISTLILFKGNGLSKKSFYIFIIIISLGNLTILGMPKYKAKNWKFNILVIFHKV